LFRSAGFQVKILDKARAEKKALTRAQNKILIQLKPTTERDADVLRELGYPIVLGHRLERQHRLIPRGMLQILASNTKKIGISAFAQHPYKVLSLEKMTEVIKYLSKNDAQVILFGGGDVEKQITENWEQQFPN